MSGDHTKISAKGGKNRWAGIPPQKRSDIMREVAKKRYSSKEKKEPTV